VTDRQARTTSSLVAADKPLSTLTSPASPADGPKDGLSGAPAPTEAPAGTASHGSGDSATEAGGQDRATTSGGAGAEAAAAAAQQRRPAHAGRPAGGESSEALPGLSDAVKLAILAFGRMALEHVLGEVRSCGRVSVSV
jgi:hypothetical protein